MSDLGKADVSPGLIPCKFRGRSEVEEGLDLEPFLGRLGEQQVVDLTAVAGTYVTVAMVLAMAEEGVPPGKDPPFKVGEP